MFYSLFYFICGHNFFYILICHWTKIERKKRLSYRVYIHIFKHLWCDGRITNAFDWLQSNDLAIKLVFGGKTKTNHKVLGASPPIRQNKLFQSCPFGFLLAMAGWVLSVGSEASKSPRKLLKDTQYHLGNRFSHQTSEIIQWRHSLYQ